MKNNLCFVLFSLFMSSHLYAQNEPPVTNNHAAPLNNPITASDDLAQGFSELALACIDKEYPNIIKHMMTGPSDVKTPKQLYPAFYGCFDWHSSVHGHWLLVRLLHKSSLLNDANMSTSSMPNRQAIIDKLSKSFTDKNIAGELAYFNRPNTGSSFERPYGLAWFLQLTAELRQWQDPLAEKWLTTLLPLEKKIIENLALWLPKLAFPIRVGEHSQTAFAFGLMLDWSRIAQHQNMEQLVTTKILKFYQHDINCPLAYEPSGQDFLSPCIAQADLMRRVLDKAQFSLWLSAFLPTIPNNNQSDNAWLKVASVSDKTDGKLAHLDGLNLSRAWMLAGIASGLPQTDPRINSLLSASASHQKAGIDAVTHDLHYMGSHWLGSFATYLTTQRGL